MNFGELWSTVVEKLEAWAQGAARMLPNIGLALITAIVLYALSKLVRKAVEKALSKTRMHRSARDLLVSIVHFASLVAVLMISSLLNIAYLMPIVVRGFFLKPSDNPKQPAFKEAPLFCLVPLCLTAVGGIALFFFGDHLYQVLTPIVEG